MTRILLTFWFSLFFCLQGVRAVPIATSTAGTNGPFDTFWGQSFTVSAAGPVDNIIFNFFSDIPALTPAAAGIGYLLDSQYLGAPSALSAATPGFLGQASAAGGFYTFNSALTLLPATQYFFYTDTQLSITGANAGSYVGGAIYRPLLVDPGDNFVLFFPVDANFLVQGTLVVGAPEINANQALAPLTILLIAFALLFSRARAVVRNGSSLEN